MSACYLDYVVSPVRDLRRLVGLYLTYWDWTK